VRHSRTSACRVRLMLPGATRADHGSMVLRVNPRREPIIAPMGALDLFRLDGKVALVTGAGSGLGRAYAFAGNELSLARARLVGVTTQADWAREAADAEEAISREHTMWRASRSSH